MIIDWILLRQQKADLIDVIDLLQSESDEAAKRQTESLTGILHLIDSLQDKAVDIDHVPSAEVFG